VNVASGHPPGLQERRDQQHAVKAAAGHLAADRLQRRHLRHHMTAQRGIAAAQQLQTRAPPSRNRDQAVGSERIALGRGRPSQAARIGQHETDRGRTERGLVGVLLQDGHDLDAVHRLRPGRVIIQHAQQQPVRGTHRADRLPEGIIIRESPGQLGEHLRCGRQAVPRQSGPSLAQRRVNEHQDHCIPRSAARPEHGRAVNQKDPRCPNSPTRDYRRPDRPEVTGSGAHTITRQIGPICAPQPLTPSVQRLAPNGGTVCGCGYAASGGC
jgi:hypothetical protein